MDTITFKVNQEIEQIHALVSEGNAEMDPCKKTLIALRLFYYLEHHHYAMLYKDGFKQIVQTKAHDFCMAAQVRRASLEKMDKTIPDYGRAEYLAIISDTLKDSCNRVLKIMETMY